MVKIGSEPVDHPGSPTLNSLSKEDLPSDAPVKLDQHLVDSERGTQASRLYLLFERTQKESVIIRQSCGQSFLH